MKHLFLLCIVLALVLLPVPAKAWETGTLASVCGFSVPVSSITVLATADGGGGFTIDRTSEFTNRLLDTLTTAQGITASAVHPEHWKETIQIYPTGLIVDVYLHDAQAAYPYRLDCGGGVIIRTNAEFFACTLLGECSTI